MHRPKSVPAGHAHLGSRLYLRRARLRGCCLRKLVCFARASMGYEMHLADLCGLLSMQWCVCLHACVCEYAECPSVSGVLCTPGAIIMEGKLRCSLIPCLCMQIRQLAPSPQRQLQVIHGVCAGVRRTDSPVCYRCVVMCRRDNRQRYQTGNCRSSEAVRALPSQPVAAEFPLQCCSRMQSVVRFERPAVVDEVHVVAEM